LAEAARPPGHEAAARPVHWIVSRRNTTQRENSGRRPGFGRARRELAAADTRACMEASAGAEIKIR